MSSAVSSSNHIPPAPSRAGSVETAACLAPPPAKRHAKVVAWGPADTFIGAPAEAASPPVKRHLRQNPGTAAAPRARSGLAIEGGERYFKRTNKGQETLSPKGLRGAQDHFLQAHNLDPRSIVPVAGLVKTAEAQLSLVRPYWPCNKARAQQDIVVALGAIVDFLMEGTDPDLASILGQSHPLLITRLSRRAKQVVLDNLMPALTLLLTAAAYETTGEVRTMALKTLAHLVAHQAWAAAPALATVEKWAKAVGHTTQSELAAACEVIRAALGADKGLAPKARVAVLVMAKNAGADMDKRALCAPLMSVCMHGFDRRSLVSAPSTRSPGLTQSP